MELKSASKGKKHISELKHQKKENVPKSTDVILSLDPKSPMKIS